jgi:hypothetical protein
VPPKVTGRAVTDRATGEPVGEVAQYERDPTARSRTFRTLIGPGPRAVDAGRAPGPRHHPQAHGSMTVTPAPGAVPIAARASGAASRVIVDVTSRSGRSTPDLTSSSIGG